MKDPVLHVDAPGRVSAVALVLHGGRERSLMATRPWQLAVLRMLPFATSLRRAGAGHGLAVARLRYRVRGWNGSSRSPVADAEWALEQLAARFPGAPVALVGHSMGGRTALYAAGHPSVGAVVGLAPWVEPGDAVDPVAGRRLLVVHGDRDRITSPVNSSVFAAKAAGIAASVTYVTLHGEQHAMLARPRLWHELATGYVLAVLCGAPPSETVGPTTANVLTKALDGETALAL